MNAWKGRGYAWYRQRGGQNHATPSLSGLRRAAVCFVESTFPAMWPRLRHAGRFIEPFFFHRVIPTHELSLPSGAKCSSHCHHPSGHMSFRQSFVSVSYARNATVTVLRKGVLFCPVGDWREVSERPRNLPLWFRIVPHPRRGGDQYGHRGAHWLLGTSVGPKRRNDLFDRSPCVGAGRGGLLGFRMRWPARALTGFSRKSHRLRS